MFAAWADLDYVMSVPGCAHSCHSASDDVDARSDISDGIAISSLSGPLIRGARALLGWSINDLAEASGVSVSTIKRMESDDRTTRMSRLEAVSRALRDGGVQMKIIDGIVWMSSCSRRLD